MMGNIPHNKPWITAEDRSAVDEVLSSGWITQGTHVAELERRFTDYLGGGAACAVSSGTAALFLALRGLGIGPTDVVILPTYTCSALLNAVYMAGAVPYIVDVLRDSFVINPAAIEQREFNAKAVIAVHTFGAYAPIQALSAQGLIVIEDCCQSLGGVEGVKPLGSRGHASVFSFYATKIITGGHGGLVWSAQEQVIDRIRDYREFDCREFYYPRFNFQLTDIQAAMVRSQLQRLDDIIIRRASIAQRYAQAIPAGFYLQSDVAVPGRMVYRFVIISPDRNRRDALRAYLKAAGIHTIIPVERFELLHRYLGLDPAEYPVAEHLVDTTLSLPLYPTLTEVEVNYICSTLERFHA